MESMPPAMRRVARETLGGARNLNLRFDRAHYVSASAGVDLWVVEGDGVTCIFRDKSGGVFMQHDRGGEAARDARRGLQAGSVATEGPVDCLAIGVVPGWARAVAVKIGKTSKVLPIEGYAYALRAEQPIRAARQADSLIARRREPGRPFAPVSRLALSGAIHRPTPRTGVWSRRATAREGGRDARQLHDQAP